MSQDYPAGIRIKAQIVTEGNKWTDGVPISEGGEIGFNGDFKGTICLQFHPLTDVDYEQCDSGWCDTGDTWTVDGSTTPVSALYHFQGVSSQLYRVGVKLDGYISGTLHLQITGR